MSKLLLPDGTLVPLDKPVMTIGSDRGDDITIDHPALSPSHAVLEHTNTTFTITDNHSAGGVFVNGEQITKPVKLAPQSRLDLGGLRFFFDPPEDLFTQDDIQRLNALYRQMLAGPNKHSRFDAKDMLEQLLAYKMMLVKNEWKCEDALTGDAELCRVFTASRTE